MIVTSSDVSCTAAEKIMKLMMLCEKKEKTVIAMFLSIFKESNFFSNPNLGTVLQVEVKEIKLLSAEMSPGR